MCLLPHNDLELILLCLLLHHPNPNNSSLHSQLLITFLLPPTIFEFIFLSFLLTNDLPLLPDKQEFYYKKIQFSIANLAVAVRNTNKNTSLRTFLTVQILHILSRCVDISSIFSCTTPMFDVVFFMILLTIESLVFNTSSIISSLFI